MRLRTKLSTIGVAVVLILTTLGMGSASAAHYQGGDYGLCIYPTNAAYDGVYVEGQGLGSDVPSRNYYAAARGIVVAAQKCVRTNTPYYITSVQIDKVALRVNNVNYGTVGPVNRHNKSLTVDSAGLRLPACGAYAQAAIRWSVRYSNGALFSGYLNSAGFRRC